jgi:UDP-3-O-[3-hydroxymyristoyl] N-acetylglucosamine deacetylase
LSENAILNNEGLRYKDEFVRHKVLDMVGDLRVASGEILGAITAYRPSHSLNSKLINKIFSDTNNYNWI